MSETQTGITASGELLLDPFSYHPQEKSAILGLGGDIKPSDPTYALHTDYVRVAEGPASFTLRFQGLAAKTGTLQLRVHMFVEGPPARFLLANTVRTQFNRLIQLGSEISVRFEGIRGVQFALHGAVLGDSDARAEGLTITLDRPLTEEEAGDRPTDLRNSEFGLSATRGVPMLLATDPPTLAAPVGQLATLAQLGEPALEEWQGQLRGTAPGARSTWSMAYVLQSLRAYGMLQDGARGIGFGLHASSVAEAASRHGVGASAAELPAFAEHLPGELTDFDFLWSIDAVTASGVHDAFDYVEGLMRCLRPGGLAVHVVPFLPGRAQRYPTPPANAFRRGEVERLAFHMIARNVEVSQLKIDEPDPLIGDASLREEPAGAFGLIFRKAPLDL